MSDTHTTNVTGAGTDIITRDLQIRGEAGLRLAATEHRRAPGDGQRPVVVAVHGYPDSRAVWSAMLPHLLGFADVVTFDVRGIGESEAPAGRAGYRLEHLVGDIDAVVRHARSLSPCVYLLAHDWGSIQAWQAVTDVGDAAAVCGFTSISGPCLDHASRWLRAAARPSSGRLRELAAQARASAYIPVFRAPKVADLAVRSGLMPALMNRTSNGGGSEAPRRSQRDMLNGLQLYRANMGGQASERAQGAGPRTTTVATQVVVCTNDPYVHAPMATCGRAYTESFTTASVDSGHWGVITHAEQIAAHVGRHLRTSCPHT